MKTQDMVESFPERLKQALRERGFWKNEKPDVYAFATKHGWHAQQIYDYLAGRRVPTAETLLLLSSQLEADPHWLWGQELKPRPLARKLGALLLALGLGLGISQSLPVEARRGFEKVDLPDVVSEQPSGRVMSSGKSLNYLLWHALCVFLGYDRSRGLWPGLALAA